MLLLQGDALYGNDVTALAKPTRGLQQLTASGAYC